VVVQPRKDSLILDCTAFNKYIKMPKIKYDDYKAALNYFRTKGYIFTFNFKDGYYHIKIYPDFKKFLGFSLVLEGRKFSRPPMAFHQDFPSLSEALASSWDANLFVFR
jgi:hypothetical protein